MESNQAATQHEIGSTTYIVISAPSADARERLEARINKLLQRDLQQAGQTAKIA